MVVYLLPGSHKSSWLVLRKNPKTIDSPHSLLCGLQLLNLWRPHLSLQFVSSFSHRHKTVKGTLDPSQVEAQIWCPCKWRFSSYVSSVPCYQAIRVHLATFRETLNNEPIESGLISMVPAVAWLSRTWLTGIAEGCGEQAPHAGLAAQCSLWPWAFRGVRIYLSLGIRHTAVWGEGITHKNRKGRKGRRREGKDRSLETDTEILYICCSSEDDSWGGNDGVFSFCLTVVDCKWLGAFRE